MGLPLAETLSKYLKVIGYDTNEKRVEEMSKSDNEKDLGLMNDPRRIKEVDFTLICVPTPVRKSKEPVRKSKEPDLSYVKSAAEIIGRNIKRGAVVVLESTVYPGVTEELVKPILEKESRKRGGIDFYIVYS